jgi:uncharacterized membrane protein
MENKIKNTSKQFDFFYIDRISLGILISLTILVLGIVYLFINLGGFGYIISALFFILKNSILL